MSSLIKTALIWIVIIITVFLLWSLFQTTKGTSEMISFSAFLDRVGEGAVDRVVIRGCDVWGLTRATAPGGRREFRTVVPANYPPMYDLMRSKGVNIEMEAARDAPFITALITWAPVLALVGLWIFFIRRLSRPR